MLYIKKTPALRHHCETESSDGLPDQKSETVRLNHMIKSSDKLALMREV